MSSFAAASSRGELCVRTGPVCPHTASSLFHLFYLFTRPCCCLGCFLLAQHQLFNNSLALIQYSWEREKKNHSLLPAYPLSVRHYGYLHYFRYFSTLQSLCKRKFSTIYIIPEARLINLCKRLQNIFSDQFCVVMLFQMILSDIDIKFYHQLFDTSKELSKLDRLGIKTS